MHKPSFRARLATAVIAVITVASLLPATAAVTQRDILIKSAGSGSAVYYLANDGKRYVFPNQKTYNTWFTSFSGVVTVSDADMMSFPLGGNVTYRPGIRLVKITTDPKVYAVDSHGTLRWISSQAAASAIYGSNWNTKIDDVPDAFFVNYRLGADINSAADFNPQSVASRNATINVDLGISASSGALRSNTSTTAPGGSGTTTPPVVVPPSEQSCSEDVWSCTGWNACDSSGAQTRTCIMVTDCPTANTPSPVTTQSCTFTPSNGNGIEDSAEDSSVTAGSEVVLARFRLNAQYEDLRLTKATLSVADAVAVSSLRLYDGDTPVSSSQTVDGSGNAYFGDVNFLVPRNTGRDLTVRGVINNVGVTGAPTGSNARVTLRTTSGQYRFEMRSASPSGSTLITNIPGGDKVGNDKIVRRTLLTATNVSLPTTVLTAGTVVAGRVKFTADSSGDAAIKSVSLRVNKPSNLDLDVTGSGGQSTMRVYGNASNVAGSSTAIGCGMGSTECVIRTTFAEELQIAAGFSITLDARLNVMGSISNGNALSTAFLSDNDVRTGKLSNGSDSDQVRVDGGDVNFAWSDLSGVPHNSNVGSSSSADWASGTHLPGFYGEPQVLVQR